MRTGLGVRVDVSGMNAESSAALPTNPGMPAIAHFTIAYLRWSSRTHAVWHSERPSQRITHRRCPMVQSMLSKLALTLTLAGPLTAASRYDVVVYGGTAAGVITAVSAAREGASVILLEPGRHIGGMVSGGLGRTDYGKKEVIGGDSLEFFERLGRHYSEQVSWFFEPRVAEKVFREMLDEAKVPVLLQHRLREKNGVRKKGNSLTELLMENGVSFRARIFADCTYEGDLMAQANVSYTVGREGVSQYGESLAGVRPTDRGHMFEVKVSAFDARGRLLPEVSAAPRGEIGAADKRVQAYNFRMCFSKKKGNQVPFPKPPNYDPKRFTLLAQLLKGLVERDGRGPRLDEIMIVAPMPNNKTDINNRGAFSTDYIGKNWDYPEASYKRRAEIWQDHIHYMQGFFYFLAHDSQVPEDTQRAFNEYALAKDEFKDTDHWPHQLYVREARRMVGSFVMTQKDIQDELTKPDVIGMGSYNSDSHNVQRFVQADGTVQNEGNMEVPVKPYQIPYRILLPKKEEAANLLVPVCFSASHVVYSTVRMEPQYMILGQAAGVAAKLAIDKNAAVQDIDTKALTARLRKLKAVMEWVQPASN
jgi:FAD dependent oxidoreductase